jgi:uncharacterized membrane protein
LRLPEIIALEFTPILIWWLVTTIFGLIGWPLAFSLLSRLPDRGFAFIRPMGLLTTGYILWLGGSFRLLQNNVGGILVAMGLVLALGLIWQRQQVRAGSLAPWAWLRQEWRYALSIELLFSLAFVGWTIFKAYNPNIETAAVKNGWRSPSSTALSAATIFPRKTPGCPALPSVTITLATCCWQW